MSEKPSHGVKLEERTRCARCALEGLVRAYIRGEFRGGQIEWDELDDAYGWAIGALSQTRIEQIRMEVRLEEGVDEAID